MVTPGAIAYQQYCPRRRFWGFEYNGGLEPEKPKLSYAVETAVKAGLRELFATGLTAKAASTAEMKFSAMTTVGVDIGPDEDVAYVLEEQTALCAAIVMNYAKVAMPRTFALHTTADQLDLGNGITIHDAWPEVITANAKGEYVATFIRVVAGAHEIDSYTIRHRVIAGVLNAERLLQKPVRGAIQYLFKGARKQSSSSGNGEQYSPLIRGYYNATKGTYSPYRISGWKLVHTWTVPGLNAWISSLGKIGAEQIQTVTDETDFSLIQMLSKQGRAEWKSAVQFQELQIDQAKISGDCGKAAEYPMYIWPQYRHSCAYCEFRKVCDERIEHPEDNFGYRFKEKVEK